MSKFTVTAATMQTLSRAAAEEASRLGDRTGDIDHLLLAIVVSEQVGGQVLRTLGITLERAREAVESQHAEQLGSLGIRANASGPGRITFHEVPEFSWNQRALDLLGRAGQGEKRGDAAAVLRELLDERSGLIEAILERLDNTPEQVRDLLDEAGRFPATPQHVFDPRSSSGTGESHVPAPLDEVWNLLADPTRMPEWEYASGSVEDVPAELAVGSAWTVHALETAPDGKSMRVRPDRQNWRVELSALEPRRAIEWTTTWFDAPTSNTRRVRIELEPSAGGTHLLISLAWQRKPGARRALPLVRWAMRPLVRAAIWLQISQLGASIGRVFR